MQFAALVEQGVSLARMLYAFNSVNVEGWALYAEAEMLPYEPIEGQFVAQQFRLLRAARAFLDGARAMDEHFFAEPSADGAPAAASGHTTGRQLDSSLARRQLRWAPRYTSFRAFIDAEGSCECSEADEGGEYPPHPGGEYPSDWLLHTQGDARAEAREREISEIDELIALVAYEEGADFDGWPSPPPPPLPALEPNVTSCNVM